MASNEAAAALVAKGVEFAEALASDTRDTDPERARLLVAEHCPHRDAWTDLVAIGARFGAVAVVSYLFGAKVPVSEIPIVAGAILADGAG